MQILKSFFEIDQKDILFNLICHLGTTFSALIFFRKEIIEIFLNNRKELIFFSLAILPLIPFYFLFKSHLRAISQIAFTGFFLIITGVLLFFAKEKESTDTISFSRKIKDVLFIGLMQAFALIPGISRSGSTIFAACFRGWKMEKAISFSYLLAIPTVFGGCFLEAREMLKQDVVSFYPLPLYLIAFCASFITGSLAIRGIYKILTNKKINLFAGYCFFLGIFVAIYGYMKGI